MDSQGILDESRKNEILSAIIYMICVDGLPLNTVEKSGFQFLLKTLEPKYKPPSRKKVTDYMKTQYDAGVVEVQKSLKDQSISITLDLATILNSTRSFLVVSAHILDKASNSLVQYTLGAKQIFFSHTADNIRELLVSLMSKFKIDLNQIKSATTDGGANIVKCVRDLLGSERHSHCTCHLINLLVTDSISLHDVLCHVINKVKRIVTFLKMSSKSMDELKHLQVDHSKILVLIQSIETRWNSEYLCIKRYLLLKDQVQIVIQNRVREQPKQTRPGSKVKKLPELPSADEIKLLEDFVQLYSPFNDATSALSGEKYVTSSIVIPVMRDCLLSIQKVTTNHELGHAIKENLIETLTSECRDMEAKPIFAKATLLDPRSKRLPFQSPRLCSRAVEAIAEDFKKIVSTGNTPLPEKSPVSRLDRFLAKQRSESRKPDNRETQFDKELRDFLEEPVEDPDINPLKFWSDRIHVYPRLSSLAFSYLLPLASSTASERIVSAVNLVASDKRSSLTSENINSLVFLRSLNLEVWEKIIIKRRGRQAKNDDCQIPRKKKKELLQPAIISKAFKECNLSMQI